MQYVNSEVIERTLGLLDCVYRVNRIDDNDILDTSMLIAMAAFEKIFLAKSLTYAEDDDHLREIKEEIALEIYVSYYGNPVNHNILEIIHDVINAVEKMHGHLRSGTDAASEPSPTIEDDGYDWDALFAASGNHEPVPFPTRDTCVITLPDWEADVSKECDEIEKLNDVLRSRGLLDDRDRLVAYPPSGCNFTLTPIAWDAEDAEDAEDEEDEEDDEDDEEDEEDDEDAEEEACDEDDYFDDCDTDSTDQPNLDDVLARRGLAASSTVTPSLAAVLAQRGLAPRPKESLDADLAVVLARRGLLGSDKNTALLRMKVLARIASICSDMFNCEPNVIGEGTSFIGDLEADALDILELISTYEVDYDVVVNTDAISEKLDLIDNDLTQEVYVRELIDAIVAAHMRAA